MTAPRLIAVLLAAAIAANIIALWPRLAGAASHSPAASMLPSQADRPRGPVFSLTGRAGRISRATCAGGLALINAFHGRAAPPAPVCPQGKTR